MKRPYQPSLIEQLAGAAIAVVCLAMFATLYAISAVLGPLASVFSNLKTQRSTP